MGRSAGQQTRVLIISNRFPPDTEGGYERSCAEVVHELRRRGFEVHVLTRRSSGSTKEVGVSRVLTHRASSNRMLLVTGLFADMKDLRSSLQAERDFMPDVVYLWGMTGLSQLASAELMRRHPSVAYIADFWLGDLLSGRRFPDGFVHQAMALSTRAIAPVPWLSRIVNSAASAFTRRYWGKWASCAPFVFQFDSEYMKRSIEADNIRLGHVRIIPHGIALAEYPMRGKWVHNEANGRLLFLGRVVPSKGVETLIRAIPLVQCDIPDVQLTVAGPVTDTYREHLYSVARDAGVSAAVSFVGEVPHEDVSKLFANHRALVFPSEWEEPFGIVLIEAMASGIPVVCTGRGGSKEIVQDERTGLLFTSGDAISLATQVVRVLKSPRLSNELARAARHRVEERYSLEEMVDAIELDLIAAARHQVP